MERKVVRAVAYVLSCARVFVFCKTVAVQRRLQDCLDTIAV